MVNALRAAAHFVDQLPRNRLAPEVTEDREGFVHPYMISGGVGEVKLQILLARFPDGKTSRPRRDAARAAEAVVKEFPQAKIDIQITPQYRNMAEGLPREPRAVAYAQRAMERLNRRGKLTSVRGGTDGSRLTELGLPTPNLSCGGHVAHSPLEWACLDEMVESVEWLVAISQVWGQDRA